MILYILYHSVLVVIVILIMETNFFIFYFDNICATAATLLESKKVLSVLQKPFFKCSTAIYNIVLLDKFVTANYHTLEVCFLHEMQQQFPLRWFGACLMVI